MVNRLDGWKCPVCAGKIVRESQPVGWTGMAAHCANGHVFRAVEAVPPTVTERGAASLRRAWKARGM